MCVCAVRWQQKQNMFAEWTSLSPIIVANSGGAQSQSVLNKFSGTAGREVAVAVVKQLASSLGLTQTAEPSSLEKDEEVRCGFFFCLHKHTLIMYIFYVCFSPRWFIGSLVYGRYLSWPLVAIVRT